jgi:hypothetical protein
MPTIGCNIYHLMLMYNKYVVAYDRREQLDYVLTMQSCCPYSHMARAAVSHEAYLSEKLITFNLSHLRAHSSQYCSVSTETG